MSRLAILAALGGAGWYAWQSGYLDQYLPPEYAYGAVMGQGGSGPTVQPVGFSVSTPGTLEENLLRENWTWVSSYAATEPELAAAIMWQESRGKVRAISSAGARGLMQVMPSTGRDLHDRLGYGRIQPTMANLMTAEGSIYFGTAYMEYLHTIRNGRSWEWYIRAYNGGPGGADKFMGGGKNAENDGYYSKVLRRWNTLRTRSETIT
ncbi:lytic transglycosylase domain-containing protein [Pseudophaeobacter flagellatus]|uniref:lytic transglycosylase domain-containing protein n=1 Tax=Pseudophaeobacter flagellatus TaxID=2899119 RepID=UPI001E535973|nr:transglycosylase SLT domain-containing protein [Pseudophaeobacter flagellatus]MCD9147870.1 transglycosylase SLT domain-containing protein [Pseudophaeobacter flagellatus]